MQIIAEIAPAGWYVSLGKLLFMLIAIIPWLMLSPWIQKDSKIVRSIPWLWAGITTGAGTIGIIIWLLIPYYVVGFLIFMVLSLSAAAAYVLFRNARVDPHLRVMTTAHIQSLFTRGGQSGPKKKSAVKTATKLKFYAHDGKTIMPPDKTGGSTDECEAYNLAQDLLHDVLFHRASEVDAAPSGENTNVRYIIDGVLSDPKPTPLEDCELIIQYLKKIGGMNVEDRRKPQKGKMSVDLASSVVEIEIITAGTTGGQRLQLRVLQEVVQTNIDLLGIPKNMLEQIRAVNKSGSGLIIVSAKPKNGLTSTMYALLKEHDTFTKQVVTLESKPSVELENITQNAYGRPDALAQALTTAVRRDPDIIMVDQCPSAQAAAVIADTAIQKTVLLGIQAPDSFTALAKWIKICEDPAKSIPPIKAILCQTLIRRLCPNCKEAYRPDPQMLAKINISPEKAGTFYRPPATKRTEEEEEPCPTCQGNGYFGRTGVFELLVMTEEIRKIIVAGGTLQQIKSACRKNRMLYLQEQALRKVMEGETSIQEVIRVTQQKA